MSDVFLEKVAHRWDDLYDLLTKVEEKGYEPETMDDLLNLFDSGTLNPNDYEFPCGVNYERFKHHVNRGFYDLEQKPVEYTREPGIPWTYPPREFIERYDKGEFSNCHFDFIDGYEKYKADVLRGLYD